MKKVLKVSLITLVSLILLIAIVVGIACWLVFTPEKLTPIVRTQAAKYIHCRTEIGEVELTFFSTFPQFGLKVNRCVLINPMNGAPCDTLLQVNELTGMLHLTSLIRNMDLVISEFRLDGGTVNAFRNSMGKANFDIFPTDTSAADTTQTDMIFKVIDVNHVDLNNINLSYTDDSLQLKAAVRNLSANVGGWMKEGDLEANIDTKPFDLSLEYQVNDLAKLTTSVRHLSAKIDGSMKSGKIKASIDMQPTDITLDYVSDSMNLNTDIRQLAFALDGSLDSGKVTGNFSMKPAVVTLALNRENYLQDATVRLDMLADAILSRQFLDLKKASVSVNDLNLELTGTVENDTLNRKIITALAYQLKTFPIKSAMAMIPPSFSSYIEGMDMDGELSSEGVVKGEYGNSSFPVMDLHVLLDKGTFKYAGIPLSFRNIGGKINVRTDLKDPQSYVRVDYLNVSTSASTVKTSGMVTRLFDDIHTNLNTDIRLVLSEFSPLLPDSLKLNMKGAVAGKIKSDFSLAQIQKMELEKMKLSGSLDISDMDVAYDSLSFATNKSKLEFSLPDLKTTDSKTKFLAATISSDRVQASKINAFDASLRNAVISLNTSDVRDSTKIPDVVCFLKTDILQGEMDTIKLVVENPDIHFVMAPRKDDLVQPEINLVYNSGTIKADLGQHSALIEKLALNADVANDKAQKDLVLQWNPQGYIDLQKGRLITNLFPYSLEIPRIKMDFDTETFTVDQAHIKLDHSDFNLSGMLYNVSSYFRGDSLLRGHLDFVSGLTDILQIMNMTSGIGSEEETVETPDDEKSPSGPYMVPKGLDILLHTHIDRAIYGIDTASNIRGAVQVYDGNLVLEDLTLTTPATDMQVTAMYKSPRKNHLSLQIDLHMLHIEIEELLRMIPDIDSIMPMLRSFRGKGEFHFSGETWLDSLYRLKISTIRVASSIRGNNLVLMDGETFSEIAKKLRFTKKAENKVDSLSAEFTVFRNEIDIFPFLVVMDRYKAVVGGRHHLDMTYDYNISIVESPLPIRLSVRVSGIPDDMKFKLLLRNPYPDFYRPASRRIVESEQMELRKLIRNSLLRSINTEAGAISP